MLDSTDVREDMPDTDLRLPFEEVPHGLLLEVPGRLAVGMRTLSEEQEELKPDAAIINYCLSFVVRPMVRIV